MQHIASLRLVSNNDPKFADFVKIGIPMTVVVGIITIILAPMVWPF